MADEPETTPTIEDVSSDDFDWGQFFTVDEDTAAPTAPAPIQPAAQAEPEDEGEANDTTALRTQVEELQKLVKDTAKTTTEIATRNRVQAAVEAWKQQASPFELQMADVLTEATSLEDLQTKAALIKRVSASSDKVMESEKLKIEQDLQRQFGLPISPTYQPTPEREKMEEALKEGDIDKAADLALKGFFR